MYTTQTISCIVQKTNAIWTASSFSRSDCFIFTWHDDRCKKKNIYWREKVVFFLCYVQKLDKNLMVLVKHYKRNHWNPNCNYCSVSPEKRFVVFHFIRFICTWKKKNYIFSKVKITLYFAFGKVSLLLLLLTFRRTTYCVLEIIMTTVHIVRVSTQLRFHFLIGRPSSRICPKKIK